MIYKSHRAVQQEVIGYGGSNGVTAIFVTRPEIHAFAGGLPQIRRLRMQSSFTFVVVVRG